MTSSHHHKDGSYGRVVRIHFACRAPLPIGSNLRVTSSQMWAPGSLTPLDPTDAKKVSMGASELALPNNTKDGDVGASKFKFGTDLASTLQREHYASSVEMVTSPEEWPVWRTRTPVVVSLRHHHGRIEQHRYRYLVVTPGAGSENYYEEEGQEGTLNAPPTESGDEDEDDDVMTEIGGQSGKGATTSQADAVDGSSAVGTPVMAWEDPFQHESQADLLKSTNSLPSVRRNAVSKNLANLPYRTIGIDTETTKTEYMVAAPTSNTTSNDISTNKEFTSDGIRIDDWNNGEDLTFCPYILREAMNKQNKARQRLSRYSSMADVDDEMDDTNYNTPGSTPAISTRVSFSQLNEVYEIENNNYQDDSNTISTTSSAIMTPRYQGTASSSSIVNNVMNTTKKQRTFFVCYHLPVILKKDTQSGRWSAVWAESLLAATEGSAIVRDHDAQWVGTVTEANHSIATEEDREQVRSILEEMNCTPLFLNQQVMDAHYLGMCKQVLWPAFHNIDLLDLSASGWTPPDNNNTNNTGSAPHGAYRSSNSEWDQSRLDQWWDAYNQVNKAFAQVLSTMLKPGDIMWVHDYHLSLLPKLMDDAETAAHGRSVSKKVFFLHIPFPTSQIFRELECGETIMQAMLHADVVGFHAFDHARHFLNAAKRILGLNYDSLVGGLIGLQYKRKTVLVTMHNVSIEPVMVNAALRLPAMTEKTNMLRQKYPSRMIISGVDIAQRLSGISLKLLAYERFLKDYPIYQEKVTMVQKCLVAGSRNDDEINTLREVRYLVKRIKDAYGPNVIDCEEIKSSSLPIVDRLALWKVSDVLMLTPIREGLNLLPLEYVFTKKKPATPGVVISSEFSAVCSVLNGALRVNPFDIQMSVSILDKALSMTTHDKESRIERDVEFVLSSTSSTWTKNVLRDLNESTVMSSSPDNDSESEDTTVIGTKYDKKHLATSTAAFLEQEKELAFAHLDVNALIPVYNQTKNRVLLLDLNGTLINKETPGKYLKKEILGISGHTVPENLRRALTELCKDPKNTVIVVSGDSQENVMTAIGHIHGVGLAASNGACFAPPLAPGETERVWKYFDLGVDWEAVKKVVIPVFAKYTARSNGSYVKMTHSSIGWSYYSCDPEWGSLQASHLVMELENVLIPFDVRFVMIKGIVEVVPRRLNKGLIVKNALREVSSKYDNVGVDFILCMGDDVHDEKMFTSVSSFIAELDDPENKTQSPPVVDATGAPISQSISASQSEEGNNMEEDIMHGDQNSTDPLFAYTVAVGKKESHAFAYVDDAKDVEDLLIDLSGIDAGRA